MPVQIDLEFRTNFTLRAGDRIALGLSGFTNGNCDNEDGPGIGKTMSEITSYFEQADSGVVSNPSTHHRPRSRASQTLAP